MKALCIVEPGHTELVERPVPVPAAGEVLVRVQWVGYCGSDLNTFRGQNPMVTFPRIPGHEVSGTIAACAAGVPSEWRPGCAVAIAPYTSCGTCAACRRNRPNACRSNQTLGVQRDGALTEFVAVPWQKLHTSDRVSLRDLALVEPLTVGFHAAGRGEVARGETVLVLGCGAIGLGAIAGAAFRGATVIAVDVDDAKLEVARLAGASHAINSARRPLHESVAELAPQGPDVVIEAIGLPATFRAAVDEVAFTGRVVYIGYAKEPVAYETKYFVQKELDIRGSRNALPGDFRDVIRLLETGRFPLNRLVSRIVPLAQAGVALQQWSENPAAFTRILVEMGA